MEWTTEEMHAWEIRRNVTNLNKQKVLSQVPLTYCKRWKLWATKIMLQTLNMKTSSDRNRRRTSNGWKFQRKDVDISQNEKIWFPFVILRTNSCYQVHYSFFFYCFVIFYHTRGCCMDMKRQSYIQQEASGSLYSGRGK